ncbi:hypothetical protein BU14_0290s0020 [Porphyra umbilicalis]|uniref:Uncharacterized protein n=1 Tax=Porphyra umbilicalis TaxID=2786 RepID=A0A1X6P0N1_PORUM|nr:hypothetical protein BU14_0290s0020 [Porphyra umbilicalis]|eukprot:OSX74412.1 hypothetical protein BU14_0290s0020 [Porphyra umbilicalis]
MAAFVGLPVATVGGRRPRSLSSRLRGTPLVAPLLSPRCSLTGPGGGVGSGALWQRRAAVAAAQSAAPAAASGALAFDKVPAFNPYEDDDDDDDEGRGGAGGGGRGSGGRGGGGGGDGGGVPDGPRDPLAWAAHVWTYNLARRPILSKAVSTSLIGLLGDLIAQGVSHRRALAAVPAGCPYRPPFRLDARRAAAVTALGFVFTGPMLHGWYETLGRVFPGGGWAAVASSVVADQSLFAPLVNGVYLMATGLMEGGGVDDVTAKVRGGFGDVWRKSIAVWVPAQAVNFGLVPLVWRVPYVNGVALLWTVLLSSVAHA